MKRKRMRQSKFTAIVAPLVVLTVAATITVTSLMNVYAKVMDFQFGSGKMTVTNAEGTENWETDYYKNEFDSHEQLLKEAEKVTEEIAAEGFVMLKNKNNALPLNIASEKEKKISCFGWSFSHPVYGGTGSGSVRTETCVTPQKSLENAGFTVNPTLVSAYDAWSKDSANAITNAVDTVGNNTSKALMSAFGIGKRVAISADERPTLCFGYGNWDLIETPASALNMQQASEYSDVALVMISRVGGEQGDLPQEMGENAFYGRGEGTKYGYNANKHYLELTDEEEALIQSIKEQNFKKIVVVVNSANPMELGELENDDAIDSIIFAPGPGQTGFNALGKILNGEVNPSGRTSDIFTADFTTDPTYCNFADPYNYAYSAAAMRNPGAGKRNAYNNINKTNSWDAGFFTQYEEGIYVGYRYYETADVIQKAGFNYNSEVVYPFGYGLSYTSFSQKIVGQSLGGDNMWVDVEVQNTGKKAGKSVVQLYVSAPYINGGIEKSAVSLISFGKTVKLEEGEKQTVRLTFTKDDLTSYDYKVNKCYVLDQGAYEFTLRSDSHNIISHSGVEQKVTWNNGTTKIYNKEHDGARLTEKTAQGQQIEENYVPATNAFEETLVAEEMAKMTILSRADKFNKMPEGPTDADRTASQAMIDAAAKYNVSSDIDTADTAMPIQGADKVFSLIDMRGLDADDEAWEQLLNQMTMEEMTKLIVASGFGIIGTDSVGLPESTHNDGPAGLAVSWAGVEGAMNAPTNAYTCEVVLGCTFNVELAKRMGQMIGMEALELREAAKHPYNGWYAPGCNIHRSPFGGRNFEYYSEDGLLSGKLCAAEVSGATEKGLMVMLKHFALNDQETYRGGWGYASYNALYTWADEQTIREIYLKPFEIAIKEAMCDVTYIADENGTVATKTIRACTGIMSAFNAIGSTWTGGNKDLLTDVLRNEWNFDGFVVTDFKNAARVYMDLDQMIHAGGDCALATVPAPGEEWLKLADSTSATSVKAAREAVKHLLYATVYTNAMNGLAPGSIISYSLAPWQICLVVANVVIYTGAAAVVVLTGLRYRDSKLHSENYKEKKIK